MSNAVTLDRRHHLDRRADQIINNGNGHDDELLTTKFVAQWLQTSPGWLEIGRCKGYGPPFVRMSPRHVRYRRGAVRAWLADRAYQSTAQYAAPKNPQQNEEPRRARQKL